MKLLNTELSTLYSKNIIFDSKNGTMYIAGFVNGEIETIGSKLIFGNDSETTFNGVIISGSNGIDIL